MTEKIIKPIPITKENFKIWRYDFNKEIKPLEINNDMQKDMMV